MKPTTEQRELFAQLCEREPRLLAILKDAQAFKKSTIFQSRCANARWHGYGKWRGRGLKERMTQLVGWEAERFQNVESYDAAYACIYDALPSCRDCVCM